MKTIETWAFVGGPCDGELRKLNGALPWLEVEVPIALTLSPPPPTEPTGPARKRITYERTSLTTSTAIFYFYKVCGLTDEQAFAQLFTRFGADRDAAGWVVMDGPAKRFRCWQDGFSSWTHSLALATRYARREDAEAVHFHDDDAWRIVPAARAEHYWVQA